MSYFTRIDIYGSKRFIFIIFYLVLEILIKEIKEKISEE